jgi:uncharacterized protein YdaU (DUF1376 family)
MAEFPYMPVAVDAYLAGTRHLTTEEHGAYWLLLLEAWRRPTCCLPDDDVLLARLAGVPADRWEAMKPIVMALWERDGRRREWRQKRQISERAYVAENRRKKQDSAARRWNKSTKPDASAMQTPCEPDAHPLPHPHDASLGSASLLLERRDELFSALGGHADQAANGKFMALDVPIGWMKAGADFDVDVLPTVRSLSAKAARISAWQYFTGAVFEARDRRLNPSSGRDLQVPGVAPKQHRNAKIIEALGRIAQNGIDSFED